MNIKLNWLNLKNFKGIKDFKLNADGKNVSVFADNGKGKTTLMDAFLWLLFNKDSNDSTNFTVKPQDSLGQDIHHLQTEVEAELLIDGKLLKLKKMQEEKWVKRQGATERVFDGHKTSYWYNEVPTKATEYKTKVDDLIDESIFKMITNPLFFNTKLKWEERRKILLEISGDATDEQVIDSDENLARLTEYLNGRSIDDYKLVLADKLKGLKKERDNIPPRIDELTRSLPNEEPDYSLIEQEISQHKETLSGIEFLMTNATNKANELNKKHQELYSLKNQLEKVKEKIKAELGADRTKFLEKKSELENGKFILQSGIRELQLDIQQTKSHLESNSKTRQRLLDEWRSLSDKNLEILSEEFEVGEMATNCPTCGQNIPEETIATEIGTLRVKFEQNKKIKLAENIALLEKNKESGLALKVDTEKAQSNLKELEKELEDKEFKLENLKISINALDDEISKPIPEPDYTQYPEYNELLGKTEQLQAELDKPVEDKSSELLQRKAEIQAKIDELNKILNGKEELEKKKARITSLKVEEKRVSSQIAELEGHKFLLEKFIVAKVNLLEDSINSQFKHVRFKLFEENITNEGVKETCIALVNTNGAYVKYEDANNAGKINAGIDVINSLSRFYEVTAPIWIDNRESVVKLADTESQVISLIVSEKDKELRVEVE
ncbi:AAA family ATPase [Tissierella praeacuta]|uniref:AAA family ATPase n=1 Tax=Tissierella praeacuta TaxID=43131 RepID=UPI003DA33F93